MTGRLSRARDLDLALHRVILHTVMHHSSTSTYVPNFIEIETTFCGRTDGRTYEHLRPILLGSLGGVDLTMTAVERGEHETATLTGADSGSMRSQYQQGSSGSAGDGT